MGTPLTKTSHTWVAMMVLPVERLLDDQGNPVYVVDPDAQAEAEAQAVYGCLICDTPSDSPDAEKECNPDGA